MHTHAHTRTHTHAHTHTETHTHTYVPENTVASAQLVVDENTSVDQNSVEPQDLCSRQETQRLHPVGVKQLNTILGPRRLSRHESDAHGSLLLAPGEESRRHPFLLPSFSGIFCGSFADLSHRFTRDVMKNGDYNIFLWRRADWVCSVMIPLSESPSMSFLFNLKPSSLEQRFRFRGPSGAS